MPDLYLIAPTEKPPTPKLRRQLTQEGHTIDTPGFPLTQKTWTNHHITPTAKEYIMKSPHFQDWYKRLLRHKITNTQPL